MVGAIDDRGNSEEAPERSTRCELTGEPEDGAAVHDAQPDWSAGGGWIAFRRGPYASKRLGMSKMTLRGRQQRLLAQGDLLFPRQNATRPARAPTGARALPRPPCPRSPTPTCGRWISSAATSISSHA